LGGTPRGRALGIGKEGSADEEGEVGAGLGRRPRGAASGSNEIPPQRLRSLSRPNSSRMKGLIPSDPVTRNHSGPASRDCSSSNPKNGQHFRSSEIHRAAAASASGGSWKA